MSAETKISGSNGFEKQLLDIGAVAINLARLALLKGAIKLAGGSEPFVTIPSQASAEHDVLGGSHEQASDHVVAHCQAIFDQAAARQGNHATKPNAVGAYTRPSTEHDVTSQYVAIRGASGGTLYLHQPAASDEISARYPFWISQETVANDIETGLPTLYYREVIIDQIGNMQAVELLADDQEVCRPLEPHESLPYYQALKNPVVYCMVPLTAREPSAE